MSKEDLLRSFQNKRFKEIRELLDMCLVNAEDEDKRSVEENETYESMKVLKSNLEKCIDWDL